MLSGAFIDLLDQMLQKHQDATKAFAGGIIFLVGDFAHLTPVPDLQAMPGAAGSPKHRKAKYLFQSEVWRSAQFKCIWYRCNNCF